MLNRNHVLACFEQALRELSGGENPSRLRPRSVALRAHAIYCAAQAPDEKRPVSETFRKFATGRLALPEIVLSLKSAEVRSSDRARLDRKQVWRSFQKAVGALGSRQFKGRPKPSSIARRAHEIYLREADAGTLRPSLHSFQRLIYGKAADPEIVGVIDSALKKQAEIFAASAVPTARRARLDKKLLRVVFEKAVGDLEADLITGRAKRRDVSRLARTLYLRNTGAIAPEPSLSAFERLLYGKAAAPEIKLLFQPALAKRAQEIDRINAARAAKGPALKRVRLDRERLRRVFQEAARRLEASTVRGPGRSQIRPLQVARRAYTLYNLETEQEVSKPSPSTFHRLIYGKTADPEIMTLIKTTLKEEE